MALQTSIVVLYVMNLLRGFSWLYLAMLIVPAGAIGIRRYSYYKKNKKAVEDFRKEVVVFDRSLGVLEEKVKSEAEIMVKRNHALVSVHSRVEYRDGSLWGRHNVAGKQSHEEFLKFTAGVGVYTSPSQLVVEAVVTDANASVWRTDAEATRHLDRVPLEVRLLGKNLGIIGPSDAVGVFAIDFLTRLFSVHSPADVCLAFLAPANPLLRESFQSLAWLPTPDGALWAGPRVVFGATKPLRPWSVGMPLFKWRDLPIQLMWCSGTVTAKASLTLMASSWGLLVGETVDARARA